MALDCNSLIHDEHFYDENSWVCWGNNHYWLVTETKDEISLTYNSHEHEDWKFEAIVV